MADNQKHPKRPRDINQRAFSTVALATGQTVDTPKVTPPPEPTPEERHNAAVMLGRKGGKARADKLTPKLREDIARKAAKARWSAKD